MHLTGDTGAYLRSTMGAMVLFGVPPEEYYPYDIPKFDNEPPAFCYAFAQNYQAIQYFRLDVPGTTPAQLLQKIKLLLAYGLPSMFGFTVFSSYVQAGGNGEIPYPYQGDRVVGGHAIVAAGYDDGKTIKHAAHDAKPMKGALFIRNSWGTGWGDNGYGWLPYDYVLKYLAVDWWCLLRNEWVDKGKFKLAT
jgi:C1A family cysteine protease